MLRPVLELSGSVNESSGVWPHSARAVGQLAQPRGSARSAMMSANPISFSGQPMHCAISRSMAMPIQVVARLFVLARSITSRPTTWFTSPSQ